MNSIVRYVEKSSSNYGNKIAAEDAAGSITFAELRKQAIKIGTALIEHGGRINIPIIVLLPKSKKNIISFMGVLYCGSPYVSLEYKMPMARLKKIISNLEPQFIITDKQGCEALAQEGYLNVLDFENLICVDYDEHLVFARVERVSSIDPAHIICTSGTTGDPKGVTISHLSLENFLNWGIDTFNIDSGTVFGNQSAFYFDISFFDIYSCFFAGSQLQIIPEYLFSFPISLIEYLKEKKVNSMFWVPSALVSLANYIESKDSDLNLPEINKILFCGEVMPAPQYNILKKFFPSALFANLYGPAETTISSTYYIIEREISNMESIPIGIPINNTEVLIITDDNKQAEINEIGELCIKGMGLSLGYWNNDKITREKFVKNPFNTNYNELIYKTGDLAKIDQDGVIHFAGRRDYQIKLNGRRIELGEIEACALSVEEISEACVLFDKEEIILVYRTKLIFSESEIKIRLLNLLPKYMVPTRYFKLDNFIYNANGKIDRAKIKLEVLR